MKKFERFVQFIAIEVQKFERLRGTEKSCIKKP
jgi:hypothetical protein